MGSEGEDDALGRNCISCFPCPCILNRCAKILLAPSRGRLAEGKCQVLLKYMVRLEPYLINAIRAKVDEPPGSILLIYPRPRLSSPTCSMLVEVIINQTFPVLIDTQSKVKKFLKTGTIVDKYDKYSGPVKDSHSQVCLTHVGSPQQQSEGSDVQNKDASELSECNISFLYYGDEFYESDGGSEVTS